MRERGTTATRSVGAELMHVIDQIGREKGIDVEILVGALEDAITVASRKQVERSQTPAARPLPANGENLIARLNRQTGEIQLFARKRVAFTVADPATEISLDDARSEDAAAALGSYVDLPRPSRGFGRIEAQAAKQVISQKVREAEREIVYNDYASKVGELIHGAVKRFERGDIVFEVGRTEAVLPRRFQSRVEMFSPGDRVRAIVIEVSKSTKGPQIVLSRIDSSLLAKFFEMEVPEIYDGTVAIRQVVREAGERSKIAVTSSKKDVEAVGACVGMKGSRVQAIIRELRGERIDIEEWSADLATFAANALKPAKTSRVTVSPESERTLEALVEDAQLSLAIGKKGQNVRLAARLVGWRIDIKSEDEKRREVELQNGLVSRREATLAEVPALAEAADLKQLEAAGIRTIDDLLRAEPEHLATIGAMGAAHAEGLRYAAEEFVQAARGRRPEIATVVVQPALDAASGPAEPTPTQDLRS